MKLLVIEPGLKLWGSERAFLDTVPELVRSNGKVVVLLPAGSELVPELRKLGVVIEHGPIDCLHRAPRSARLRAAWHIARQCRKHRIEKIYLNQAGLCRIAALVARLLRLPLVIHVRLLEDIERCARLTASRRAPIDLIFISEDMRSRYPARIERWKRLSTVYDAYSPTNAANGPDARKDFVCIGRLAKIKGQIDLVDAMAALQEQGLHAHLDIIGTAAPGDAYTSSLTTRIADRNLGPSIHLMGFRSDAAALLRQYRFVVVPSHYEPLGRVVMEAWDAHAVPIASFDSGGPAELIGRSGGGLLYRGRSAGTIADALKTAANLSPEAHAQLVTRGRTWMHEHLSIEKYSGSLGGVLFSKPSRGANAPEQSGRN